MCLGVVVLGGGGQGGDAQRVRAGGEGRRGLDEGGRVSESAQAPLLGQDLLVGHGVDGVWECEGGTGGGKQKSFYLIQQEYTFPQLASDIAKLTSFTSNNVSVSLAVCPCL